MAVIDFRNLEIRNRRVLIREDLNVPLSDGVVTSDARINAALPTIQYAVSAGAQVMVMSHLGRPVEGQAISTQPEFSLAPVAARLAELSGLRVQLVDQYLGGFQWPDADVVLFENVRVNSGEKANSDTLSQQIAALCDIYVMDAFATAHRAQATTEGAIRHARVACAGPLLKAELDALAMALQRPERPLVAVVGGSKVSTKLTVLEALADQVDELIVGGGIANTFLAARGSPVGRSLAEHDMTHLADRLMSRVSTPMPTDVVVARDVSPEAASRICKVDEVADDEMILDIGPESSANLESVLRNAGTILWNGPLGVFEIDQFGEGTRTVAEAIAGSAGFSVAGGGDTLAAIEKYGVTDEISYISTGGGAFLEFVEGKSLPAVAALEASAD